MKTNHTITALFVTVSLAIASPVLAQRSRPCPDLSQLKGLEKLEALESLNDLPDLRALSRLGSELSRLSELSKLADLGKLGGLAGLADLAELGSLGDVTAGLDAHPRARRQVERHARDAGPQQTEKFSRAFRVGRNGSLDLGNISGDIVINAGGGDEIVINATKRTPQGSDAQRNLQAVTIVAEEHAGHVEVKTQYPERANNIRTSVDFTVTVPPGTTVNVHSISGDIGASGTKGALRLTTVSGDVKVDNADQVEELKSISGNVTLSNAGGVDVRMSTVSGNVDLRNVKVRALDSSSISGDASLTDVAAERAAVKTLNGDVEYAGPFARNGRYEFKAHSGDIRIIPTSNTGFEVSAETFSGGIQCDLPITAKSGQLSGRHVRRELKGTVGDGSAMLTVTTFSGDVTIRKK